MKKRIIALFVAVMVVLTLSSAGLPVAVSRMVAHYLAKEEPQNIPEERCSL